jgi:hypothetical protein
MQNPQMPPRDRIKRPEIYLPPEINEPEPIDDSEGLSQDDLNEWLTQKVIRLELEHFRKESREGRTPLQQRQRMEPERLQERPKELPKKQPYETMYGKTEEEAAPIKKAKGKSKVKTILMLLAIAGVAYLLLQVVLYLMGGTVATGG